MSSLVPLHALSKLGLEVTHVDFLVASVLHDAHESSLQVLDILTFIHQFLQVIGQALFGGFELFVLNLEFLGDVVELFDLAVGKLQFFLSSLDVRNDVRLVLGDSVLESLV